MAHTNIVNKFIRNLFLVCILVAPVFLYACGGGGKNKNTRESIETPQIWFEDNTQRVAWRGFLPAFAKFVLEFDGQQIEMHDAYFYAVPLTVTAGEHSARVMAVADEESQTRWKSSGWSNTTTFMLAHAVTLNKTGGEFVNNWHVEVFKIQSGTAYGQYLPPAQNMTKTGYTFAGWYDNAEYTGAEITRESLADLNTTELFARWTVNTYAVSFNLTGGDGFVDDMTVEYLGLYGDLPVGVTRDGYDFVGWFDAQNQGNQITSTTVVETANPHTLFAHWSPKIFVASFDYEGFEDTTIEVAFGQSYQFDVPTKYGYAFQGWSASGGTVTNGTGNSYYFWTWAQDMTFYPYFTARTFSVEFAQNGEKALRTVNFDLNYTGSTPIVQTVDAFGELTYPVPPARNGYIFAGWYVSGVDGTWAQNHIANLSTLPANNTTFLARWQSTANVNQTLANQYQQNVTFGQTITRTNMAWQNVSAHNHLYPFVALKTGTLELTARRTGAGAFTIGVSSTGSTFLTNSSFNAESSNTVRNVSVTAGNLYFVRIARTALQAQTPTGYEFSINVQQGQNPIPTAGGKFSGLVKLPVTFNTPVPEITAPNEMYSPIPNGVFAGYFTEPEGAGRMIYNENCEYVDAGGVVTARWDYQPNSTNTTLYAHWVAE